MYSRVPKFSVIYEKNAQIGGVGHVSIEADCGDEKATLSVCPHPSITATTPLKIMTFFTYPGKAINQTSSEAHHDATATYEIPASMMRDPHAAFKEMQKINRSIATGSSGYSLLPSILTSSLYALTSPRVNVSRIQLAMKTGDREAIDRELKKTRVTNCAKSVSDVLMAGGIRCPSDIGPFYTPSGINRFFQNTLPSKAAATLPYKSRRFA